MTVQRRKWRLERWLAVWVLGILLLSNATGCVAVCAVGACATCLEGTDDDATGPLFTFSPGDSGEATGPFDLQLALTDEGRGHGVATIDVEVDGELATMWNALENVGSVQVTPAGSSHDVALLLVARDADGNDLEMQAATIHWTAVESLTLVECNGTDCVPLTFGQTVFGTMTIGLDVLPDPVDSVSFTLNATSLGTDSTAPYRVDVDFTQFANGPATLFATVTPGGATAQLAVNVIGN
jgi:hypothetical protein